MKAAASQLGDVTFNKEKDAMQHRDSTKFHIYEYNRQQYLHTASDQCQGWYVKQTQRVILGHYNYDDIQK